MAHARTPLLVRIAVVLSVVVTALGIVAYVSGRQTPIDIVALVKHRDGVVLESEMIPTNGIKLHVVQAGPKDGPPVVLLHGYPELWIAWRAQIERLAKAGFRVIAPDQRGYDASDKPPGISAYRVENMVGDILGLIQTLGYDRVDLAGHDWGGAIAWYLVIEHPEHFRRLVMFNAPHPLAWVDARKSEPQEKTINWFRLFFQIPVVPEVVGYANNWSLLTSNLRNTSRPGTFSDDDFDLYRWAWFRDGAAHSMINWYRAAFQYPHKIEGDGMVQVPTRIVWGMQDRFFENRMGRLSVPHCANAELIEVAEAGHWLLHEEPEMTSQKMIEFLK
ncbi:MAG TPA: alpha/beta hydrolase [Candidatus Acidoferrales bacterium]|nr:alpha/beta hydrolase [Candidatus Acidoferrales bacterium]